MVVSVPVIHLKFRIRPFRWAEVETDNAHAGDTDTYRNVGMGALYVVLKAARVYLWGSFSSVSFSFFSATIALAFSSASFAAFSASSRCAFSRSSFLASRCGRFTSAMMSLRMCASLFTLGCMARTCAEIAFPAALSLGSRGGPPRSSRYRYFFL